MNESHQLLSDELFAEIRQTFESGWIEHKATCNFDPCPGSLNPDSWGNLLDVLERRHKTLDVAHAEDHAQVAAMKDHIDRFTKIYEPVGSVLRWAAAYTKDPDKTLRLAPDPDAVYREFLRAYWHGTEGSWNLDEH